MSRPRPAAEIDRAVARLSNETLIPLAELAGKPLELNGVTLTPSADVLVRWGTRGKAGVYLDVVWSRRHAGWATSRAALRRFAEQLRERTSMSRRDAMEPTSLHDPVIRGDRDPL